MSKPTPVEHVQKISQHSKACCTIPPIVPEKEYKAKGTYETIDGIKTYVTGPASATVGIFVIADIFGYYPQTLQGADILSCDDTFRVFVPDFWDNDPCPLEWYPPTPATAEKLGNWFKQHGDFPAGVDKTLRFLESFKKASPKIEKWAGLGYCWGGKVISLTSGENTPWTVSVQCHPAGPSGADAAKITIPHMLLASMDESKEDVEAFEKNLKVAKHVETWDKMIHGWMAARGDLDDPAVVKEYENGYKTVLDFMQKHLSASSGSSKI
ncbi:hypothetical protein V496_00228 [Pseudogymnoascus sp. VKM F-4515 (FW-2607)]|nr:hypothetical protein V496_00228 [Pseudogymnoascus sp. VKM F-4515 (FW-2607)]